MVASLRIEIFPADVDVTTSFYERLGFQVTGRNDGSPRYASIRLGTVRIGVCEADPVDPARRAYPAMTEIVIEVDDVHATGTGSSSRASSPPRTSGGGTGA